MYYVPTIVLLQSTALLLLYMASPSTSDDSATYPTLSSWGWKSLDELNKQLEPLGLYLNWAGNRVVQSSQRFSRAA